MSHTKTWIPIGAGLLVASGAAWFVWGGSAASGVPVPEAFTVENFKKEFDKPESMKQAFEAGRYEELTEEQQRQVRENKGKAYEAMWQAKVDEWLAADEADRDAILDRHIEAFEAEADRYDKPKKSQPKKPDPKKSDKGKKPSMSRQERQAKSESANPDEMAQMMAYKTAWMRRAQARGAKRPGSSGGKRGP